MHSMCLVVPKMMDSSGQPPNVYSPMVSSGPEIVIDFKLEQSEKAQGPISFTPLGIVIDSSLMQDAKAAEPIVVTDSGIEIDLNSTQL